MSEAEFSFLPLQVLRVGVGGKRTFEPEGKRRLIEACRQPDVSLSRMALKAGINANQLRKWMVRLQPSHLYDVIEALQSSFFWRHGRWRDEGRNSGEGNWRRGIEVI